MRTLERETEMNLTKIDNGKRVLSEERFDYLDAIVNDVLDKYVHEDYDELKDRIIARIIHYFFSELGLTLYEENNYFKIEELSQENHVFSVRLRSKKTKLKQTFTLKFLNTTNDLFSDTREGIEFNSDGAVGTWFFKGKLDSSFKSIFDIIRQLYALSPR